MSAHKPEGADLRQALVLAAREQVRAMTAAEQTLARVAFQQAEEQASAVLRGRPRYVKRR